MRLGRAVVVARFVVVVIVCASAVSLAAPQVPRLVPSPQAIKADVAGDVGAEMLIVLLANFPERTADIAKAIDQAVASIPRTATADLRLTTIQTLAVRLTEKHVALEKIEPLLNQAYAAFDPVTFASEQKAQPAEGRPITQAEITARIRHIRSNALETLGALHLAMGDEDRAIRDYTDAIGANPWAPHAPLALAEMAIARHDDRTALEYYMLGELGGHLTKADVDAMRALYAKQHGSESGLAAALDRLYRERFPNPITGVSTRINRLVVAELFTGTGCSPCVSADLAWDKLIERYGPDTLAMLEFHANIPQPDPMVVSGGDARRLYYRVPGVPSVVIDGERKTGGGVREAAPTAYADYVAMIEKALTRPAQAAVHLEASSDGRTINVIAAASNITSASKDLRLHVVLAEREVHYTGENGVRFHTYVVRSVAAPAGQVGTGFPVAGSGGAAIRHTFDLGAIRQDLHHTLENELASRRSAPGSAAIEYRADGASATIDPSALVVVAYLQDPDKHVLQAARVDVRGTGLFSTDPR